MEIKLIQGDYVADGLGGIVRCSGADALLARVLFRLTARRGQFPLLPQMGSQLYLLGRETAANRSSAARRRPWPRRMSPSLTFSSPRPDRGASSWKFCWITRAATCP